MTFSETLRSCATSLFLCASASSLGLAGAAAAAPIDLGDFSGTEAVETFASATPNDQAEFFVFGDITISNIGDLACCPAPGGPTVVVSGSATGGLFGHVDAGAASFGNSIRDGQGQAHFIIDFAAPVERAGFFVSHSGSPPASWDVTAHYMDGGSELQQVTQQFAAEDEFVGFEDPSGVVMIEIVKTGGAFAFYSFVDDVRTELPVPEPAAPLMLGAGMTFLGFAARRRNAMAALTR